MAPQKIRLPISNQVLHVKNVNRSKLIDVKFQETNPFIGVNGRPKKTAIAQKMVAITLTFSNTYKYTVYEYGTLTINGLAYRLDQPYWDTTSGKTMIKFGDSDIGRLTYEGEPYKSFNVNHPEVQRSIYDPANPKEYILEIDDRWGSEFKGSL